MWYKIKEGKHRASPLSLGIHLGKTREEYIVKFDESCLYEALDWEDDTNKLVGWSYGFHHKNSIRVGWRPSRTKIGKIEISLYTYDSGIRNILYVGMIDVNKEYKMILEYFPKMSMITLFIDGVIKEETSLFDFVYSKMKPTWGYTLSTYFGGSFNSPKDMKIWLKKL